MYRAEHSRNSYALPSWPDILAAVVVPAMVATANLLLPRYPGFPQLGFSPYLIALLLLGVYASFWAAAGAMVVSAAAITVILPALDRRFGLPLLSTPLPLPLEESLLLTATLAAVMLALASIHRRDRRLAEQAGEISEAEEQERKLTRENETLLSVVVELRDRFALDNSSITTLYHQIPSLYAHQLPDVLRGLAESVRIMTRAGRLGVYEFVEEELALVCKEFITDSETTAPPPRLELSRSIEGWVVRREQLFSIKRLLIDPDLRALDDGRVIMCGPIRTGRRLWGVVTVEEMPFSAYNDYTEKAFELILALAAPAIENAVPPLFAELAAESEDGSSFRGYEEFDPFFKRELESAESTGVDFALMLMEVVNLEELGSQERQPVIAEELNAQLATLIADITGGVSAIFQYKERNQLAVLLPAMHSSDFSHLSRQIVEAVSDRAWSADGEAVFPEILIAYATASESDYALQPLIAHTERLLARQSKQYRSLSHG